MIDWIECNSWDDLPMGTSLVKIDKDREPYNVAEVAVNTQGHKIVVVGNHFSFDMGRPLAYGLFNKFEQ